MGNNEVEPCWSSRVTIVPISVVGVQSWMAIRARLPARRGLPSKTTMRSHVERPTSWTGPFAAASNV